MSVRDRATHNVSAFSSLPESYIEQIKRKETREWAHALVSYRDEGKVVRDQYTWMAAYYPKVKAAYEAGNAVTEQGETLPDSPLLRYPLLRSVSYYSVNPSDVIEYVNMMDKKHKKSKG